MTEREGDRLRGRGRARPGEAVTQALSATPFVSSAVLTLPNLVSGLRLLLVPVFAVLLLQHRDVAALAVLAFSSATDWLDGRLARRLNQRSRLGELLDPAADRLFIFVTIIVLAIRELIPWWLVGILLVRDLLLTGALAVLVRRGIGPLPVHFVGKAGTFALLYAFPLLLLASWDGVVGSVAEVSGWAFAWWGVGLYWFAAAIYLRQAFGELSRQRAGGRP